MIVTLTANPSLDRTLILTQLRRGAVHRTRSVLVEPSGKGVNVARALAANGHPATAVLPLGGVEGSRLAEALHHVGLNFVGVPVAAPIRSNITLLEDSGVATKVNEPGPRLTDEEVRALLEATERAGAAGRWTVCSGSLPPGVDVDFYARVVARVHARGGLVAVDTAGAALRSAASAGADLLKPNLEELIEVTGRPLATLGEVVAAAEDLRRLGAGAVLASLGPDGAMLVGPGYVHHAEARHVTLVSPVGAGDALLAGFLAGSAASRATGEPRHPDPVTALRTALTWAAACCATPNCETPAAPPDAADKVIVHDPPDLDRPLTPAT